MALFVLNFAEGSGCLSSSSWRNAWGDPPGFQHRAIIVSIVSLVCDHDSFGALTDNRIQEPRTDMIRYLASRQAHGQRSSVAIADGMAFGVQSGFCAPDVAGNTPLSEGSTRCDEPSGVLHRSSAYRGPVRSSQVTENPVEHTGFGRASKAIAERLVQAAGASFHCSPCFNTQTMPDTTRRSSTRAPTRATPWDLGKNGSIFDI